MDARVEREIRAEVFGERYYEPIVRFYDHAVRNEDLTKKSGRPRFTEATYIWMKPTHPDLSVRDERSRLARDDDKQEYPKQWEAYQKSKAEQANMRPPLQAIPGMTVTAFEEFKALDIFDCAALAAYEGDIEPWERLQDMAKRIMEISDEFSQEVPEERQAIRAVPDRREHTDQQMPGKGAIAGGPNLRWEATNTGDAEQTFHYEVKI